MDTFDDLQSILRGDINKFLIKNKLDTPDPSPVKFKLFHMGDIEAEFITGQDRAIASLHGGPKTASQIAEAIDLEGQLNNVLLCLVEEECLIQREETDEIDDIFRLVESDSLSKTENVVLTALQGGSLSRDAVFQTVHASDQKTRHEWIRKILKDLVASGKVTSDANGKYSLVQ